MSFDHSFHFQANAKPGVNKEQVINKMQAFSEYMGWDEGDLQHGRQLPGDDEVEFSVSGSQLSVSICSSGEVGDSFCTQVATLCEQLTEVMEPCRVELHDHSTGDLENAITYYWIGEGEELALLKRHLACQEAFDVLRTGGVSESELAEVGAVLGHEGAVPNASSRPKP